MIVRVLASRPFPDWCLTIFVQIVETAFGRLADI
jgi:hypothetical protein